MKFENIPGEYTAASRYRKTKILFSENGRFRFEDQNLEIISSCKGNWKLGSKNEIVFQCDDHSNELEYVLATGYMEPTERRIILLNKNKIKFERTVLKRVKK